MYFRIHCCERNPLPYFLSLMWTYIVWLARKLVYCPFLRQQVFCKRLLLPLRSFLHFPDRIEDYLVLSGGLVPFLILCLIFLAWCVYLQIQLKNKLKFKYSVLWNKKNDPICPFCKEFHLEINTPSNELDKRPYFYCQKCIKKIHPVNEQGETIHPLIAKEKVSEK